MITQSVAARLRGAPWLMACVCAVALIAPLAHAQQQPAIPPAATPGGALPRTDTRLQTDAAQPADVFQVPKMSERPLGLEEGPRLKVTSFKLIGATDRPEEGVSVKDLNGILDAALKAQPETGYTVNQLHEIAGRVGDYYHKAGFMLAQAFVPAQQVLNGEVTIEVLVGRLGAIRVEGNKSYSAERLTKPFDDLLGGPVEKGEVESSLLRVTDYPGLSAFGVFSAGQAVGTTDLLIQVQKEDRVEFNASLDNYGSQFTGEYRGQLGLTWNNVSGHADRATFYVLDAFDPDDSNSQGLYGGADYTFPFFSPANSMSLSYSTNAFDVGQALRDLDIAGDSAIADATFRRVFSRSRLGTAYWGLGFAYKEANFKQQDVTLNKDKLSVAHLDFFADHIDTRLRGVNQFSMTISHGFDDLLGSLDAYDRQTDPKSSRVGAGGEFTKYELSLQRLQRMSQNTSLLMRLSGQYSPDPLLSLEQLTLGGPDTVRAYPTAEILADKGAVASLEVIFNAPGFASRPAPGGKSWGQVFQVSLFIDYAHGELNNALANEDDNVDLSGWGGALQFNFPGHFYARADVATPITDRDPSNGRDPQYYIRFAYTF